MLNLHPHAKIIFTRKFSSYFLRGMSPTTIMRIGCQEQFNYLILLATELYFFAYTVGIRVLSLNINLKKHVKLPVCSFTYKQECLYFL